MNTAATKTAAAIALLALGFGTVSCSAPADSTDMKSDSASAAPEEVEETPEPVDLTGERKQTNSENSDSFQSATIGG